MTTVAMIFGMMPLALAIGAGAEQRAPMARAVIGGLITSTLLTLFVVPVMYTLLDDLGSWVSCAPHRRSDRDARRRPTPAPAIPTARPPATDRASRACTRSTHTCARNPLDGFRARPYKGSCTKSSARRPNMGDVR